MSHKTGETRTRPAHGWAEGQKGGASLEPMSCMQATPSEVVGGCNRARACDWLGAALGAWPEVSGTPLGTRGHEEGLGACALTMWPRRATTTFIVWGQDSVCVRPPEGLQDTRAWARDA